MFRALVLYTRVYLPTFYNFNRTRNSEVCFGASDFYICFTGRLVFYFAWPLCLICLNDLVERRIDIVLVHVFSSAKRRDIEV